MIRFDFWIIAAPLLLFLFCASGGLAGVLIAAGNEATANRNSARALLLSTSGTLKTNLVAAAAPVVAFAGIIKSNPAWDVVAPQFRHIGSALAADVITGNAVITFVLAPQAVVREIVPPDVPGWAVVLGLDLLQNATWRPDAYKAVQLHNELIATGPVTLRAGPVGVVARYPVWIDGVGPNETWGAPGLAYNCDVCYVPPTALIPSSSFWGFVQVNIDWARLLELSSTKESLCGPYASRIEYITPGTTSRAVVFSCGGIMPGGSEEVSESISVMHNDWVLHAGLPRGSWAPVWRNPLIAIVVAFSALFACVLFYILLRRALFSALLRAILPKRVVSALVRGNSSGYVECASGATVLFVDIVGFTSFSALRSPLHVFRVLNDLYYAFDSLALEHGCYKVETVGDAFLVVTGLDGTESAAEAASRAADFAIALVDLVPQLNLGSQGERVRIRVGLASGPIVAGVIGFRTPHFCIFGDTVNT
jgi:hypothetical protein